jgi:hypothetical protein
LVGVETVLAVPVTVYWVTPAGSVTEDGRASADGLDEVREMVIPPAGFALLAVIVIVAGPATYELATEICVRAGGCAITFVAVDTVAVPSLAEMVTVEVAETVLAVPVMS